MVIYKPPWKESNVVIYKYPLDINVPVEHVQMPIDAKLLHIGWEGRALMLWALCSPEAEQGTRAIQYFGTGNSVLRPLGEYIETVHDPAGYIWHYFDCGYV